MKITKPKPQKPPGRNRFEFRLTPEQRELFFRAAARDDRPLASWVRSRLEKIAQEETAKVAAS